MVDVIYAREPLAKQLVPWRFAFDRAEALCATSETFGRAGNSWLSDDHRGGKTDVLSRIAFSLFQRERLRAGNCLLDASFPEQQFEQEEQEEGTV
jgi:hypothetical protein